MKKSTGIVIILLILAGLASAVFMIDRPEAGETIKDDLSPVASGIGEEKNIADEKIFPMEISALSGGEYPGGDFVVERMLPNGTNYRQSVVSYQSEGLKIFGLLTVPLASKPESGFPAVVFVHGHIPPKQYSTTGSYPGYQATLARGGFVTFKPDLRGHGQSEGEAVGAHFSEKYIIDTLNAIAYLKKYDDVDPDKLGYWGHSNGGEIGLRVAVISPDIKAYSFWSGVVGSYVDEFETYNDKISFLQGSNPLVAQYGLPSTNPEFWNKIDPYHHLKNISAPIELQHATGDKSVPVELSRHLRDELEKAGKEAEYKEYAGDDHNISANSGVAWQRTINFFKGNL